ncbi:MAG: heavy metal translocating P-type ATPase [Thermodesulfobacteriaceae bacterium]|nr:heavy metal translocating P-type ATPase [Thermodesulfobacteriaceae bacterium]MDW8135739.1 heavy metal translocating P-type ATPase [Thermodesulfobacterium sp.]
MKKDQYLELPIVGMTCAACVKRVSDLLLKVPGIKEAKVNLITERATIKIEEETLVDLKEIVKKLQSGGYDLRIQKLNLHVEGLSLGDPLKLEKEFLKIFGITKVSVNPATEILSLEYVPTLVEIDNLKKILEKLGYGEIKFSEEEAETYEEMVQIREYEDLKRRFLISAILTGIILLDMITHFFYHLSDRAFLNYFLFFLTTPVVFYGGSRFFRAFFRGIRHLSLDMNTLIALGTGSAYVYSVVATFFPSVFLSIGQRPAVYYETAAIIITLILFGRMLETKARRKTTEAIRKLASLQPKRTILWREGQELEVELKEVQVGDVIVVKPGERIPLDGLILEGFGQVDESVITGESFPVDKKPGDKAIGGTLNLTGSFKIKVTQIGKDTVLSNIIKLVKEAQATKPSIQRLADRIASVFVPIVMAIGIFSFLAWFFSDYGLTFALMNFISVLMVACPCALGLATPTAIAVSTGKAAELGILIKNPEVLEMANKINYLIFDKTGTLTYGKPEVVKIYTFNKSSEEEILRIIASVEKNSEHPLGKAIVEYAKQKNIALTQPEEWYYLPGKGIVAKFEGKEILVGNSFLMEEVGIDIKDSLKFLKEISQKGETPVLVGMENKLIGVVTLADKIKEEAWEVIEELKRKKIKLSLLTGDNFWAAKALALKLGIEDIWAEVLPEDKAHKVEEIKREGYTVAMVGDGVNDAPALATAHLGIAIGSGTEVASATADIILIKSNLKDLLKTLKLSIRTYQIIKQNFFWAFFYNILLIPIAAGLFYPFFGILLKPVFASAAMAFSSLFVLTNSLRIKRLKL